MTVPGGYPTIQAAINAASIGDTIDIAAGTYSENVNLKAGVCLEGVGVDQTTISKSGAPGVSGNDVSYVIIKNLTVSNSGGNSVAGGGISLSGSTNISLQSCRLTGNVAANGGGIYISQSNVTVDHCLIDGNTAHNMGAGMVMESNSVVTFTNVTMANNKWTNNFGNGGIGGIRSYSSSLQMTNSIVWGNNVQNLVGNGVSVSHSDVSGWYSGANSINADPRFSSAGTYELQSGSPASGMGSY